MTEQIGKLLGKKADAKRYMESERLVSNSVGVGVELELENIQYMVASPYDNYPKIFGLWRAVGDGSLREGIEYIFDGPLKGINITDALDIMQSFLGVYSRNGKPVNITDRCSVHVHLDVTDLDKDQLNNLIQIYYLVERLLFQYINPLRIKNNYCRALTDSSFRYTLKNLLKNSRSYDLVHIIQNECDKYSALNVLPVTSYGSVEFRHHHGTTDMAKILDWINIIMSIKLASLEYPIEYLLSLHKDFGSIKLIQTIFKGTLLSDPEVINGIFEYDKLINMGVLDLKEIHNLDELKALNTTQSRKRASKKRVFLESFKKENGLSLMGVE
jgi:hypothetical protein